MVVIESIITISSINQESNGCLMKSMCLKPTQRHTSMNASITKEQLDLLLKCVKTTIDEATPTLKELKTHLERSLLLQEHSPHDIAISVHYDDNCISLYLKEVEGSYNVRIVGLVDGIVFD